MSAYIVRAYRLIGHITNQSTATFKQYIFSSALLTLTFLGPQQRVPATTTGISTNSPIADSVTTCHFKAARSMASSSSASTDSDKLGSTACSVSEKYLVGYVTISNQTLAEELATKLVTANLVACVNIVPTIQSIYQWQGKVENERETLMILKVHSSRSNQVIDFVRQNHPYSVPEVIFTPIMAGNPDYLRWIDESVNSTNRP